MCLPKPTYLPLHTQNTSMKKIKPDFILFDMIGTTIQDSNGGKSLILTSFRQAFKNQGYDIPYETLNRQRGKTKRIAIETILSDAHLNPQLIDKIYHNFIGLLNNSVSSFTAIEGATAIFKFLKTSNIKIGIGSGLPLQFMHKLLDQIGWHPADFDYIGSSDELGEGRPNPIMILEAKKQLGLEDTDIVLKIGDTVVDVQEGKNAGVLTAMVLTGTQNASALGQLQADYVLNNVKELEQIILL